jgi:DNA invertase Pin-like site-specific DNA recombinase
MRAAIYVRVSTKKQSVDLQLKDLEAYAQARGWTYTIYHDQGISGSKTKRPQLDAMLDAVRKRQHDVVLVWRFDRFARSSQFLVNALDEFNSLGVNFISYQENIDTGTPMGKAMYSIIAAMAQLERDIIRERVQAGVDTAREKGVKLGRPVQCDRDKLKELKQKGLSYSKIALEVGLTKSAVAKALKC